MLRRLAALLVLGVVPASAETSDISAILDGHVMPGYQTLAAQAEGLASAAQEDCRPDAPGLRTAYHAAFDAWVGVSHLRFGPSETEDRAFALAFWPDSRGATPRAVRDLIVQSDPVADTLAGFQTVSIAARGFYALEFMLFDPAFVQAEEGAYRCGLVQVMSADIAANAQAILTGWEGGYADLMRQAGANETFRDRNEAIRQIFTALSTGLEFTAQTRLGRPMGTFERPRPMRAEARRSGRSLRHVMLSLLATRDLTALLSDGDPDLDAAFARALDLAERMDDPVFAGVSTPQGRFEVEALQSAIDDIRRKVAQDLGPRLGIAAGFNALDGD